MYTSFSGELKVVRTRRLGSSLVLCDLELLHHVALIPDLDGWLLPA